MKIIIASEIFPPDIGGPATYVEKMATSLVNDNHQVSVITYSDQEKLDSDNKYNFEIIRIKRCPNIFKRYFFYFYKLLKLSKPADLIFAQGPIPSGFPSILVKIFTGKKVVIKVVGDFSWERSRNVYGSLATIDDFQKQKYPIKLKILRWMQKIILNLANTVITPSHYLKKIVIGWGVRADKVRVVYNAIEQIDNPLTKDEAKKAIGCQGKDIIISVGRLVSWKGFETLIELFPKILEINNNFKLLIIGDGPERNKLEKQIGDLRLRDGVILCGQIKHEEMLIYMKAAYLFILNTAYEGLSHLLVESLMMKLPIITTNIGGNPEVIQNNYNGILVEYNNKDQLISAIRKLWQDKERLKRIIDNSQKSLNKFQFNEMYQQTLEIIKGVALGSP